MVLLNLFRQQYVFVWGLEMKSFGKSECLFGVPEHLLCSVNAVHALPALTRIYWYRFIQESWTKHDCLASAGPEIQDGPKAENAIWGKNRKCMRMQMLKIVAGHMMWGGLRPPPCGDSSCGPLVSAFASACISCFCPLLYFLLSAHIVFPAVRFTSFSLYLHSGFALPLRLELSLSRITLDCSS